MGLLSAGAPAALAQTTGGDLVVVDPQAEALHVYALPGLELAATFDGPRIDTHAGIVLQDGGRLLLADQKAQHLLVLDVSPESPEIVGRIPIPVAAGAHYGWSAADESGRYYVVTSDDHESATEVLNIVDLETGAATQIDVDTGGAEAELGVALGGDPLTLVLHLSDRAQSYALESLVGGPRDALTAGKVKPVSSIAIGEGGHGNSVAGDLWLGATKRGLEMAMLKDSALVDAKVIPWDVDGRSGGRNARQRLTVDGSTLFGPLFAAPAPENWADAQVDLHWVDLPNGSARRTPLAKGLVGRGGVSGTLAAYTSIGADGDLLNLVDVARDSDTFQQVVATVQLEKLSDGPVAGEKAQGRNGRYAAITPDGKWAFATHGGDGKISVIDTGKRQVAATIVTPTPLMGTGYIVAVQEGAPAWETSGR